MASVIVTCDFEVNQTKIKGGCQSGIKVAPHDYKSDLNLVRFFINHQKPTFGKVKNPYNTIITMKIFDFQMYFIDMRNQVFFFLEKFATLFTGII